MSDNHVKVDEHKQIGPISAVLDSARPRTPAEQIAFARKFAQAHLCPLCQGAGAFCRRRDGRLALPSCTACHGTGCWHGGVPIVFIHKLKARKPRAAG